MTPAPRPRPQPARARRSVAGRGTASVAVAEPTPDEGPAADDELTAPAATPADPSSAPRERKWTSVLAVTLVLAVTAAAVAVVGWAKASDTAANANRAVVDTATTSAITGQLSDAVETVFSFEPKDMAKTEQSAQKLLTGDAIGQYNTLYGQVKQMAPAQGLTMTTTVKSIAVLSLIGDRADVLLFADQKATRNGSDQPSVGGAQLRLLAQQVDGTWRIAGITVL